MRVAGTMNFSLSGRQREHSHTARVGTLLGPKDGYMTHDFRYIRPKSLEQALDLLSKRGEESCVFSGGTDLLVDIRAGLCKPDLLVDLKAIESLHHLSFDKGEGLGIGACVTINELIDNGAVQKHYTLLATAGKELATHQIRNRATVVGNVVTASPCGDMASPLLCLDAELVVLSKGGPKKICLAEFITGVKSTTLKPDEIVEKIVVPPSPPANPSLPR